MKNSRWFHSTNALMAVIAILFIAQTMSAKTYSSAWDIGIVLPSVMGLFLLFITLMRVIRHKPVVTNARFKRFLTFFVLLAILFFLGTEAVIISDPLLHSASKETPVGVVIILGCGLTPSGQPSLALSMRLAAGHAYYLDNPGTKIIVSGGQGWNEPIPEAEAMRRWLASRNVPETDIYVEDKSTSTMENFRYSAQLMMEQGLSGQSVAFATNDFHVLRSRFLARRNGLEASAIAAPTPAIIWLNVHLREFFALYKSLIFDR